MTFKQMLITILLCSGATVLTRLVPFAAFSTRKKLPSFLDYLGKALPSAVFGMLVVYCLRNVVFTSGTFGIPELASLAVVAAVYAWRRDLMSPMVAGTAAYMLLIRLMA